MQGETIKLGRSKLHNIIGCPLLGPRMKQEREMFRPRRQQHGAQIGFQNHYLNLLPVSVSVGRHEADMPT